MVAQVKKACQSTAKDIIYASDADVPGNYQEWKKQILHIDHNWRTRKAEQGRDKVTEWKQQAKTSMTSTAKGNQQPTSVPEKTMGTVLRFIHFSYLSAYLILSSALILSYL